MSADRLRALLADGGIGVGNVPHLNSLCQEWFMAEPNLATFALHFLFQDLADVWGDSQGVPVAEHDPFEQRLLPCLVNLANLLSARPGEVPVTAMDELAKAYRDSCRAANRSATRPLRKPL